MAGTGVGLFSSTGSNNTSNLTVNFAENMAPSNVNNAARELMGHIRDMYEQLGDGYFEFGDGDGAYTVTRGDADTITITGTGDITAVYYVGRKIRITDGGGNVVEGVISASSHSSTTQTIDLTGITLASGTPTKVELGIDTAAFGGKVILDDDGDTYIEAPTDDTIDIYVAGAKDFVITANTFTAESGSTITSPSIKTPLIEFTDGDDAITIADGGGVTFPIASTFTLGFTSNAASTITTADNTDTLKLVSTDADANVGPRLKFFRDSSSPADNDQTGQVTYAFKNSAGAEETALNINCKITDVTDGTEGVQWLIESMTAGQIVNRLELDDTETVFNEDSVDVDFRVESNSNANQFKVDAGANYVSFGTSTVSKGFNTGSVLITDTRTTGNFPVLTVENDSASFAAQVVAAGCLRSASTSYFLFQGRSGNGSDDAFNDIEFNVKGDGTVFADGAYDGNGADYAEYFEWKDGNSSSEDRRGYSVVLDGNKIVKATSSDDVAKIIGVISATPAVVGDSDIDRWKEKYLKDDFGSIIMEKFTVTSWKDEADKTDHSYETDKIPSDLSVPSDATVISTEKNKYGETVNFFRKKINPDWNKDTAYISREDRKEWDTVGLMGKLRLKKGQPTGTNWIKMRDISSDVEEWLVR